MRQFLASSFCSWRVMFSWLLETAELKMRLSTFCSTEAGEYLEPAHCINVEDPGPTANGIWVPAAHTRGSDLNCRLPSRVKLLNDLPLFLGWHIVWIIGP
jgi:hypothetical protein